MPEPSRLLVVTQPVLAEISREEVEEALPRSDVEKGFDHVEIMPFRASLKAQREVDWTAAMLEQEKQFNERLADKITTRGRLSYLGFVSIPLAVHLGYLVEDTIKIDVYQRRSRPKAWTWDKDRARSRPRLRPSNVPELGSRDAGPVVMRVSVSQLIAPGDTRAVVPSSLAEVDVALVEPKRDAILTREALNDVTIAFNQALSQLKARFPNVSAIHLFAAVPVGLAFRLGTQINPTMFSQVVTYQYSDTESPKYKQAIILGERTMNAPTTHFLDDLDYDWTKPEAAELYEILVRAYGTPSSAGMILAKSGVDKAAMNLALPPRDLWMQALEVATKAGRLRVLAQNARQDPAIAAYGPKLERLLGSSPGLTEARAKGLVAWAGKERITGKQETFLEMSFLHEALRASPSVVRLTTTSQAGKSFHGTGFLIAPDTILTNYHVLFDDNGQPANQVEIWFNYELDANGKLSTVDSYGGDPSTIVGDQTDDWGIVRPLKPFRKGYPVLSLRPSKPVREGDFVYIVQHPGGRPKKIGLLHNEVVSVTHDRVQYLTDTLGGSSGSPVCNEQWQVVALHAAGVPDDDTEHPRKNEGIHIDRVVEGLVAKGILDPTGPT